jgi:hypothetical protein
MNLAANPSRPVDRPEPLLDAQSYVHVDIQSASRRYELTQATATDLVIVDGCRGAS